MRKRVLFKSEQGYPIDAIVDVLPNQRILVKWLEDDRMTFVPVDSIIKYEDAPAESTQNNE